MKLISSKLTSLVSLEQSQLKPIRRYSGSLLKLAYLPIDISWECTNETRFVSLVDISFTDPPGGLKMSKDGASILCVVIRTKGVLHIFQHFIFC